ncbi:MAG: DUF4230 domain-containing protein [Lachnospiraceae bacterium]|nr:DUF4230 domain-containing protein [Lachnospiraceae bacterium]
MSNSNSKNKKVDSTLTKAIIILVLVIALLGAALLGGMALQKHREVEAMEKIDNTSITQKVVGLKQLTTAQLTYHGLVEFEEGKIRFINQKEFLMTYTAKVTAGVDFSQAEVKESDNQVTVKLPAAKIQTITIDPDSIEFYDIKKALFNRASKEDAIEAEKIADEDIRASMDKKELLNTATIQAREMVKEIMTPALANGMTLVIE